VDSLRPQRRPAVTDDSSLLATVGVKEQAVMPLCVWSDRERWPGSADIRRQGPHDGIVASEAVAVVVVVDYGDFDGHAVEVHHSVDHGRGLCCCDTWEKKLRCSVPYASHATYGQSAVKQPRIMTALDATHLDQCH